jgi:hydroxymethylglutaryl-CoA lyase
LRVGFDMIDFGSFVSKDYVPQMKDTQIITDNLYLSDTNTKLLAIVGNLNGTKKLIKNKQITYIGFPFSISNTFLKLNINSTINKSLNRLSDIIDISIPYNKKIVVYISMGFGNPYGDNWNIDILLDNIDQLLDMGVTNIKIADTIGISTPDNIYNVFKKIKKEYPMINFGLHLHTNNNNWYKKIKSAYDAGVRYFDSAIGGFGGCPLSGYDLVSNLDTLNLLDFCFDNDIPLDINQNWLEKSLNISNEIFKYK